MVLLALGLIALGVLLTAGAFALSTEIGAATIVVAVGPFIVAVQLLWQASQGQRRKLAIGFACAAALGAIAIRSIPYWKDWDLMGEAWVTHAEPMPRAADGSFDPPSGDPYGACFPDRSFSSFLFAERGDDDGVRLGFVEAHSEGSRYVATRVVRLETRRRFPWEGMAYQRAIGACTGTATYEDDAWTLAFTNAACAVANGRCLRRPTSR